jgi:AraC-like DNA-binding protein
MRVWTADELRRITDRYLSDSLRRESPPQVQELAANVGLARSDFSRLFAHLLGQQPSAYLRSGQIACAKRFLAQTNLSMNVIAYRCGFGTRTTFFRAFKRITGTTPQEYRRRTTARHA